MKKNHQKNKNQNVYFYYLLNCEPNLHRILIDHRWLHGKKWQNGNSNGKMANGLKC